MLQGVWEFFKDMIEEEVKQKQPSPLEEELLPLSEPFEKEEEVTQVEMHAQVKIEDYINQLWDYLTDFYGGIEPTCARHLLAGLARNGNLWFVPSNHILMRYLETDESLYEPMGFINSHFGNFVVYENDRMNVCIKFVAELCNENGKKIDLEQKELTDTLI